MSTIIIITIITVNLYSAFFVKEPKRAACASLVEREQKGFEVVLERLKEKDYCEFQFEGPAYANERPPYEASFTRGKSR